MRVRLRRVSVYQSLIASPRTARPHVPLHRAAAHNRTGGNEFFRPWNLWGQEEALSRRPLANKASDSQGHLVKAFAWHFQTLPVIWLLPINYLSPPLLRIIPDMLLILSSPNSFSLYTHTHFNPPATLTVTPRAWSYVNLCLIVERKHSPWEIPKSLSPCSKCTEAIDQ